MHAILKLSIKKQAYYISFFICFFTNFNIQSFEDDLFENYAQYIDAIENCYEELTQEEFDHLHRFALPKPTTLIVYIAADNNLHPFAWKNIKQMETIGSNENINIIVQINTPGSTPTKRYIIKNGRRLLVPGEGQLMSQKLNSGSPQTLIDCVAWAMKYYPAENLILNLWNHGAGVYEPGLSLDYNLQNVKLVDPYNLFRLDPTTNMLVLDRSIEYIISPELFAPNHTYDEKGNLFQKYKGRGICFDETFKSYLSNQDLKYALSEIQTKILKGKKIGVLWFDACLMAMIEIANICKDHVSYLVGSQEVEYAAGSNYEFVLNPFLKKSLHPKEFASHVVHSFEKAYQSVTKDFTQSATDLSLLAPLESNINLVAGQLLLAMQYQYNNSVIKYLQKCKTRPNCICFQEPSFIDIRSFYTNLQTNISTITLTNSSVETTIKYSLSKLLNQGIDLINQAVIANKVGTNLQKAGGLSIYFPERGMFSTYPKCSFAQTNNWGKMICQYMFLKK